MAHGVSLWQISQSSTFISDPSKRFDLSYADGTVLKGFTGNDVVKVSLPCPGADLCMGGERHKAELPRFAHVSTSITAAKRQILFLCSSVVVRMQNSTTAFVRRDFQARTHSQGWASFT